MRKGKDFELKYKWLYELNPDKYTITSPAYLKDLITNSKREIDVLIEYYDSNNIKRKMAIECRDRKSSEDTMWIEQLVTKRNDLGLDYILATTTKDFTSPAIAKAKHYGVIIEKAASLNIQTIKDLSESFFCDLRYAKLYLIDIVAISNGEKISKEYFHKNINIFERKEFELFIDNELYHSIDVMKVLTNNNVDLDILYNDPEHTSCRFPAIFSYKNNEQSKKLEIFFKISNVPFIKLEFEMIPIKISLPMEKSFSVFDAETKSNKNHIAEYILDDYNMTTGQIDDKVYYNLLLNKLNPLRFLGYTMKLNTIYSSNSSITFNFGNDIEYLFGSLDFSKFWN